MLNKFLLKASQWPDLHHSHTVNCNFYFAKRNTKGRTEPNTHLIKSVNSESKQFDLN